MKIADIIIYYYIEYLLTVFVYTRGLWPAYGPRRYSTLARLDIYLNKTNYSKTKKKKKQNFIYFIIIIKLKNTKQIFDIYF